jgi:hypothetical protein
VCKLFVGFSAGDCCNVNEPSVATLNELSDSGMQWT